MSAIDTLINQINDSRLRERLTAEWDNAKKKKKFGLVFEDHLPELLPLYSAKPRKGDLVCRRQGTLKDVWQIKSIHSGVATCVKPSNEAHPSEPTCAAAEPEQFALDELLVVREFGEPIFPALMPVDTVANGLADAPWHTLIEADNYHALQLLDYLYAEQVDCIYIDPPYNTGARDWKYNNDYVDGNDGWRHSKWLAFMEKRLKLANRLLKPESGVLIVTIDEHEVHHLGMLLKRELPDARMQMVTIVNNGAGVSQGGFYRVEEYAFFCFLGNAKPFPSQDDYLSDQESQVSTQYWFSLIRYGGINALPSKRANLVYPIAINDETLEIVGVGKSLKTRVDEGLEESATNDWLPETETIGGHEVVWPYRGNGSMATWQMNDETLMTLYNKGYVRVRRHNRGPGGNKYSISYVKSGHRAKIEQGLIPVLGREFENGPLILGQITRNVIPKTVWRRARHDAGKWGSRSLREALGDVTFDYAKSPYAVADCLRSVVGGNKSALILDFFSGSGTTLNAINLINTNDDGNRRCILVTNNEVSGDVAVALSARGLQPGDAEWEAQGICRSVTWPRSKYTILGKRDDGSVLSGEYLTGKTVEREKSRSFTQIGFVDPAQLDTLPKKKQVVALIDGLPQTLVKDSCLFIVSEGHKASVLFDPAAAEDWLEALDGQDHITDFYIVTPVKRVFDQLKVQVVELLGPILVPEEEKRPMSAGFAANLAYFKLDFLERERVSLRRAFREILPLLWLKAGAVGPRPELKRGEPEPVLFAPEGSNFVVLLDETRMGRLLKSLEGRTGLSQVFIVTDADESFKTMAQDVREVAGKANPGLVVVQLYRDYLLNFMINKNQDRAAGHADTQGARA